MKQSKMSLSKNNYKKVVVIGGGTGTFVVISGLKNLPLNLTAIITVADSGGSTGRLRDEFGFLPVGDLRQSLAALARENGQDWIRKLLLYRFTGGKELKGHNLGNLILTALQDMAGSTPKALEIAGKIFRLDGTIYPSTLKNVQLVTEFEDGTTLVGEHELDNKVHGGKTIKSISLRPKADIYSKAAEAIKSADLVIIGPGDLYGSLLPNLVVEGAKQAFSDSNAKVVYVTNLMTRFTQTHDMTALGHVKTLEKYLGKKPDFVILNTGQIPSEILKRYQKDHEFPVKDDLTADYQVIRGDFVSKLKVQQKSSDQVERSLLRHDQDKLTQAIIKLI